jgi:galactitol-specific phosphotransferase system IIB component
MDNPNKTSFSHVLEAIVPMMEVLGVGMFSSHSVWSMVLGVLPKNETERDKQMMEFSRKDSSEHKVDNINTITRVAKLFTKRPDYSIPNITEFTYAIRQLNRYVTGDEIASSSLSKLKKIYISYITSYYHESMTLGKKKEASVALKYFSEDILQEDEEMSQKFAEILTHKMLS